MRALVDFMIYFTAACGLALLSAAFLTLAVMIVKPLFAEIWRDFWRERP